MNTKSKCASLVLLMFAAPAFGGVLDLSGLNAPINITGSPTYIDGYTITYDMTQQFTDPVTGNLVSPATCAWDGTFGFSLGVETTSCVGGQVDSAGIYGTSDGTYMIGIDNPSYYLNMRFMIGSVLPIEEPGEPDADEAGVVAVFLLGGDVVGFSEAASLSGSIVYHGARFDTVYLNFSPSTLTTEGAEMDAVFGQTLVNVYDINDVPEPGSTAFVVLGLAGLAALGRRRRSA